MHMSDRRESSGSEFKPEEALVERGAAALLPLVELWGLPVNPEDLGLMAYLVLSHTLNPSADEMTLAEIAESAHTIATEESAAHRKMLEAMTRSRKYGILDQFIVAEGPNKGRISDKEVALELALTDEAWRAENDGRAVSNPPERMGKSGILYSESLESALGAILTKRVMSDITDGLPKLFKETHDEGSDPELADERWLSWRIATKLFDSFGVAHGFDYETCNELAALPFSEAFEAAYNYLSQAGLDPDKVLEEFKA